MVYYLGYSFQPGAALSTGTIEVRRLDLSNCTTSEQIKLIAAAPVTGTAGAISFGLLQRKVTDEVVAATRSGNLVRVSIDKETGISKQPLVLELVKEIAKQTPKPPVSQIINEMEQNNSIVSALPQPPNLTTILVQPTYTLAAAEDSKEGKNELYLGTTSGMKLIAFTEFKRVGKKDEQNPIHQLIPVHLQKSILWVAVNRFMTLHVIIYHDNKLCRIWEQVVQPELLGQTACVDLLSHDLNRKIWKNGLHNESLIRHNEVLIGVFGCGGQLNRVRFYIKSSDECEMTGDEQESKKKLPFARYRVDGSKLCGNI